MSSSLAELLAVWSSLSSLVTDLSSRGAAVHFASLQGILQTARSNIDTFLLSNERVCESRCVRLYLEVLGRYLHTTLTFLQGWSNDSARHRDELCILVSKLGALMELFEPAVRVPSQDLFSKEDTDPAWQRLRQVTQLMYPENDERMQEKIQSFAKKVAIGNAMLSGGLEYRDEHMRKIMVGGGAMYYFFCRDSAVHQAKLSYTSGDLETAKALWNLVDSKLVSPMYQSLILSIHLNQLIYVPRSAAHVLEPPSSNSEKVVHTEQLLDEPTYSMAAYTETMDPGRVRIPVRVLSPYDLPLSYASPKSCWSLCCGERIRTDKTLKELIIHMHGGGFIAMSSASHQNYTRRWATDTRTPILSVDYRLAPENRFPDGLDDCWQVYMWVITHAKKYLGINPQKIILTGDSAGGNFALGVTLRCVQSGIRIPDGLLLTYPCVSLDVKSFSPSLSLCLEDPLVPYSFLKLCAENYVRMGDSPQTNPFLSPILATSTDLSHFPPVRMMVCSNDPLLDESLRFADRLLDAGVNVKIAKFEGMGHGALNLDLALGVSEARLMVDKGTEYLRELLERCK